MKPFENRRSTRSCKASYSEFPIGVIRVMVLKPWYGNRDAVVPAPATAWLALY